MIFEFWANFGWALPLTWLPMSIVRRLYFTNFGISVALEQATI